MFLANTLRRTGLFIDKQSDSESHPTKIWCFGSSKQAIVFDVVSIPQSGTIASGRVRFLITWHVRDIGSCFRKEISTLQAPKACFKRNSRLKKVSDNNRQETLKPTSVLDGSFHLYGGAN